MDEILKKISRYDDEKALKELFDSYHGKLFEIARYYVTDYAAAQEVVSDVFIKLWKNRTNIEGIGHIGSYLIVATKRQSLNYIRDNKKRIHLPLEEKEIHAYVEVISPEKLMLNKEFEEVLNTAIQGLPSKCRLVYSLVKDDGMKYQQVADALNISIKTVEMHVGKALKRIKIAFEKYQK